MKGYDKWRESEVKRIGLDQQRKAENKLDNHESQPLVELTDARTGEKQKFKEEVSEVFRRRRTHEKSKLVFTVPALPWKDDK